MIMRPSALQFLAGTFACKFALDGQTAPMFALMMLMFVLWVVDMIFFAEGPR